MTDVIRSDSPRRSPMGALAVAGLVIGILWFTALTILLAIKVANGFGDNETDIYMAIFLGMVFVLLGVVVDVYRRGVRRAGRPGTPPGGGSPPAETGPRRPAPAPRHSSSKSATFTTFPPLAFHHCGVGNFV